MRITEWVFYNELHPVYERPPQDDRWIDPLPGMDPRPYTATPSGYTAEPLRMDMVGFPSVDIHQSGSGATVQQVTLRSENAVGADIGTLEALSGDWLRALEALSHGPYSASDLADMGHPYGYGTPAQGRMPAEQVSWERIRRPRRIPAMGSAAYAPGLRGRVPDRSVVNEHSGTFAAAWQKRILRWYGGVTLLFLNPVPYSWFLAHGTYLMQAHGPWETVARRLTPRVHAAWRQATHRAWAQRMDAMKQDEASEGQFGTGSLLAQTEQFEAGGFA